MVKLGWRKLAAWGMVYALVAAASLIFKYEIPANNVALVQWVTGFFFGANAVEHLAGKLSVNVGGK